MPESNLSPSPACRLIPETPRNEHPLLILESSYLSMDLKKSKLMRFNYVLPWEKDDSPSPTLSKSVSSYQFSGPLMKFGGPTKMSTSKVFPEDHEPWRKRILDPGSDLVLQWNRVFLFSCLVALFIDPLYFYLPLVGFGTCMKMDLKLGIVVKFFRTVADLFYMLHMGIKFRMAYVAPISRVFGRGEFVMDSKKIAVRYLKFDFFVDLAATLPLPQIVIWSIIPTVRNHHSDHTNDVLALIILLQYLLRLYLVFPSIAEIIKATGVVTKTAWAGSAYNLLLYMLASHVSGHGSFLISSLYRMAVHLLEDRVSKRNSIPFSLFRL